jgi:PBP superfamily domain
VNSLRRVCALAGAAVVSLSVVLMPSIGGAAAQASPKASPSATTSSPSPSPSPTTSVSPTPSPSTSPSPSPSPSHTPKPKPHRPTGKPPVPPGGVVVAGPRMYDPATNSRSYAQHSWVTVSQVNNLVNQVVTVTWRGFTSSSSVIYKPISTDYPVMVAECKGTHPTKWRQCFGANNGGIAGSFSPYGPMNTSYSTTSPNGTGEAFIQVLTGIENQLLGCDKGTPCSLVIVPSQGGNIFDTPPNCADHSQDTNGTDVGAIAFNDSYGACSWKKRIIVPLHFAPTPTDCPVHNPNFSAIGSPLLERAMSSWQSNLCSASSPVNIQYDSAQNEPLARQDFLSGTDDVALTTLPGPAKGAAHPFTYAPVAISAESIVFWIDNPKTGRPLTHIKLDPRLVAKLLTQSYDFEFESCGKGRVPKGVVGCDNAVDNNPFSLFADPEFKKLNPHVAINGDGFQIPTVLSGLSDMVWELTRWMAANSAAKSFVDGAFDPWGMHVNTDYLNMQLPTQSLSSMDPFLPIAHRYDPVFPLSSVAQYQVDNWYPATDWQPDSQGNYDKLSPELPGNRALFAILDQADAAAYELPVAALENAAGKYVLPTDAAMSASLATLHTDPNHITQDLTEHAKKAMGAYPLTMVIYAMVPTGGIPKKKAKKIAQWLDFVANQGQVQGNQPGDLPPGYLPLTAKMRAQTLKAAKEVLSQKGNPKPAPSVPPATATPKPSPSQGHISLGFVSNPLTAGLLRYALPILLIAGAMLAVGGSFALAIGRGGAVAVSRLRRFRMPRMRLPKVTLPRRNKP